MKKISLVLLVIALTLTLSGCAISLFPNDVKEINKKLSLDYYSVDVVITEDFAEFPDDYLESHIVVTRDGNTSYIEYNYEQFRIFDEEDLSDNYKYTQNGRIGVVDGVITQAEDEGFVGKTLADVDLPYLTISANTFSFQKQYFDNIKSKVISTKLTTFEADVKQEFAKSFTNCGSFDGTDLHVVVKFVPEQLIGIKLTYTAPNNAQISISYFFNR